jgi:hypothetical protein
MLPQLRPDIVAQRVNISEAASAAFCLDPAAPLRNAASCCLFFTWEVALNFLLCVPGHDPDAANSSDSLVLSYGSCQRMNSK